MKTQLAQRIGTLFVFGVSLSFTCPAAHGASIGHEGNFDYRQPEAVLSETMIPTQKRAMDRLRQKIPTLDVTRDSLLGLPSLISARNKFLTGPSSLDDLHGPIKTFLNENAELFGYDASILQTLRLERDFPDANSGMRSYAWKQEVDGIPIFEGVLVYHVTKNEELISIWTRLLPNPAQAADAGTPNRTAAQRQPLIGAAEAVVIAARSINEIVTAEEITAATESVGAEQSQRFRANVLMDEAQASLVWLPVSHAALRLAWSTVLTGRTTQERFNIIVDAETGEPIVRRCWTAYQVAASYRIYPSDSPTPFSPGHATPSPNQPTNPSTLPPEYVSQSDILFTSSTASPIGWVADNSSGQLHTFTTLGNNIDARLSLGSNQPLYDAVITFPSQARPSSQLVSGVRRFWFTANPATDPKPIPQGTSPATDNQKAAVVNAFYWANWMHDRLYDLGFNEANGNYQRVNFSSGVGGDPILINVQFNSENNDFNQNRMQMTIQDGGGPNHMRLQLFNGPKLVNPANPMRDAALNVETVLHEYTHAMNWRLVGMGNGLGGGQAPQMDEGWADFFPLCLLAGPSDDLTGNHAAHGYSLWHAFGVQDYHNYYYGPYAYPYSLSHSKNPLALRDIDYDGVRLYPGIPRNPILPSYAQSELQYRFYNQISLWGNVLWQARANLISKYGFNTGNERAMKIVLEAMKLTPTAATIVQARDAILSYDTIQGGVDRKELWAAFYKRGMGGGAKNLTPPLWQDIQVLESFNREDFDLDGYADLIFQTSSGSIKTWSMNGQTRLGGDQFVSPSAGSTWKVKTAADINRDGKVDLILQDDNSFIGWWLMNSHTQTSAGLFEPSLPSPTSWKIVAAGHFNQDTIVDLVWQKDDSNLAVWYMGGTDAQGNVVETKLATSSLFNPQQSGLSWRVLGTGDFNQDGQTDLLFQHSSNGDLAVWLLNGVNLLQATLLTPANPGSVWKAVATGDYNRDGWTDIMFQINNPGGGNDGILGIWLMNVTTLTSPYELSPNYPGAGWKVVGPR